MSVSDRKVDTGNKMQERSTSNRKGRIKESMKRFVGKSGILVIAEGFMEGSRRNQWPSSEE